MGGVWRGQGLFLWEAFVSGAGKRKSHLADARAAVTAFGKPRASGFQRRIWCEGETFSMIGAALLRSGWSRDLALLSKQCVVVSASPMGRVLKAASSREGD